MADVKRGCLFAKLYTNGSPTCVVPKLLTGPETRERLRTLKGWRKDGKFITKVFEFETFMEGIAFINEVAKVAEKEEHHPDIHVRYTRVTLSIQSHSVGGVTGWDVDLARAIEKMLAHHSSRKVSRTSTSG